ncbi:MAG TPA: response regulator [Nitrosopumilaceae archaeon]|nr:response regulator [Nitrosopumilaceae archaeon]
MARIMIADDSDAIRMVLKDILEIGHHELVSEATNGEEAVERFNATKPDLLLLDLAMPKKDGLYTIKEIITNNPNAKIIMITASDNLKTMQDCLKEGALSYILKPFDFDQVLKIIARTLDKNS